MSRSIALVALVASLVLPACGSKPAQTTTPDSTSEEDRKAAPEGAPGGGAGPKDEMPPDGTQADPCDGGEVAPN